MRVSSCGGHTRARAGIAPREVVARRTRCPIPRAQRQIGERGVGDGVLAIARDGKDLIVNLSLERGN